MQKVAQRTSKEGTKMQEAENRPKTRKSQLQRLNTKDNGKAHPSIKLPTKRSLDNLGSKSSQSKECADQLA